MIRLFVSDLDGSLLNEDHMLDDKIVNGIRQVLDNGYYFSVATGRNMATGLLQGLENDIYHICMNGAITVEPKGKIINMHTIDPKYIEQLMDQFPEIPFEWISENHVYLMRSKEQHMAHLSEGNRRFKPMDKDMMEMFMKNFVFDCTREDVLAHDIMKINCMPEPKHFAQLEAYLANQDALVNAPCDEGMFEITNKGVNKGEAVLALAQSLHIDPSEVAVYGDGGNDLEMLSMFEHSYSPNSSLKCALNVTHNVINSCKEYGVITHILETIEKQK